MKPTTEYMIEWQQPDGYDPADVLQRLPSPISQDMREIYNFAVKPNGFYLIDRGIESRVAGHALKLFIDEALSHTESVTVRKLPSGKKGNKWQNKRIQDIVANRAKS